MSNENANTISRANIFKVVVILLSLGFTGYIFVKFIYPLLEALVGVTFAIIILLLVGVLTGFIQVKTANLMYNVLMDVKEVVMEEYEYAREIGFKTYVEKYKECEESAK